jgi:hypothetical protein
MKMDRRELLAMIEEGLENGRLSPHIAAFIAADLLGVEAYETGYQEWAMLTTEKAEREEELVADD